MTGIALLLPMPLVLETGLEPVRPYGQRILSPLYRLVLLDFS